MAKKKSKRVPLTKNDTLLIWRWFVGYEFGMAILIEREYKTRMGLRHSLPTILKMHEAKRVTDPGLIKLLKSYITDGKKNRDLVARLSKVFQRKKRRRK